MSFAVTYFSLYWSESIMRVVGLFESISSFIETSVEMQNHCLPFVVTKSLDTGLLNNLSLVT